MRTGNAGIFPGFGRFAPPCNVAAGCIHCVEFRKLTEISNNRGVLRFECYHENKASVLKQKKKPTPGWSVRLLNPPGKPSHFQEVLVRDWSKENVKHLNLQCRDVRNLTSPYLCTI